MSLDVTFTLSDEDLDYFRGIMVRAQKFASTADESEIIERAQDLLKKTDASRHPSFVSERLDKLRLLTAMLSDKEWPLESQERLDIVSAMAYFYKAEDIIHDDVPVLGLIDDAILIELVVRELAGEIQAYEEFCEFRSFTEALEGGKISREDWLESRRHKIFERMRDRLDRTGRTRQGVGRLTTFSLS